MYKVAYLYGNAQKIAYVCAEGRDDAKRILLEQYLVGDVQIVAIHTVNYGVVVYPDGRF